MVLWIHIEILECVTWHIIMFFNVFVIYLFIGMPSDLAASSFATLLLRNWYPDFWSRENVAGTCTFLDCSFLLEVAGTRNERLGWYHHGWFRWWQRSRNRRITVWEKKTNTTEDNLLNANGCLECSSATPGKHISNVLKAETGIRWPLILTSTCLVEKWYSMMTGRLTGH